MMKLLKTSALCLYTIFVLLCTIILTSCGNLYGWDYTIEKDPKEYPNVKWEIIRAELENGLSIFPKSIDGLDCTQFTYRTDFQVMDNQTQLLLSVKYSDEDFMQEKERLSAISYKEPIRYDVTNFSMPAYVATMAKCSQYEYALIDEEQFTIHYVHFRFVKEPKLEPCFCPQNFSKYCLETEESFTIYYYRTDKEVNTTSKSPASPTSQTKVEKC